MSFAGSARQMRGILLVLGADVLKNISVREKPLDEIDRDGFRKHLRIRNRNGNFHMPEIAPMKSLLNAHVLAMAVSPGIEPCQIIKAHRVDHERVAFPFSDRVSQPRGSRIGRQFAAVGEDLAEDRLHFVQDDYFPRRLDDLERLR